MAGGSVYSLSAVLTIYTLDCTLCGATDSHYTDSTEKAALMARPYICRGCMQRGQEWAARQAFADHEREKYALAALARVKERQP